MATFGAYVGSTLSLLFNASVAVTGVLLATAPEPSWPGVGVAATMFVMSGWWVVKNDWPNTWKPLFTKTNVDE